jgi:hypothetical protein
MRRLIITSVLSSLLMGPAMVCAAPADGAYVAGRPAAAPIRASTGFDSALRCMDDLLARSQYGNGINLYATDLQDLSAVGAATRDMIVAAAARLSEKSRFFTVHPATGGPPPAGAISLVARGSITQYDKAVTGQGTGGGGSLGVTGVGGRQQKQSSVLTVTLYFLDPSGALVPGTVQTVSMALMTTNNGADVTAEIGQFGGFFELEFSRSDGPHQAAGRGRLCADSRLPLPGGERHGSARDPAGSAHVRQDEAARTDPGDRQGPVRARTAVRAAHSHARSKAAAGNRRL